MSAVDVLAATADRIEQTPRHLLDRDIRAGAGSFVFCALFEASRQVCGWPAIVALQRHLRIEQIQHWRETDPAVIVAALRAAAKEPAHPGDEVTAVRRQLAEFHRVLAEAIGWDPWAAREPTDVLVAEVADRLGRLEREVARLTAERDKARHAPHIT